MDIYPFSQFEHQIIENFHSYYSNTKNKDEAVFYSRMELSPAKVFVIDTTRSNPNDNLTNNSPVVGEFYQIWQNLNSWSGSELSFHSEYQKCLEFLNRVGLKSLDGEGSLETQIRKAKLWRFRISENPSNFILLVNNVDFLGVLARNIYQASCYFQLEMGNVILHASGVIHKKGLFIFIGPSGAGKTTAAGFAQEMGAELLDEDQILVRTERDGMFYGDGWAYQIKKGNAPMRGVFYLVQSDHDKLMSIPKVNAARILLDRFFEVVSPQLSIDFQPQVFAKIASLARNVPTYELYFCKSPDFWKLIDEKFPD